MLEPSLVAEDWTPDMLRWRYKDWAGLGLNLEAMRLMAQLTQPRGDGQRTYPIDASPMLDIMRYMTTLLEQQRLRPGSPAPEKGLWWCCQLFLHKMIGTQVQSCVPPAATKGHAEQPDRGPWMSSWLGIAAASHVYFYSVLYFQYTEQTARRHVILRILSMVDRDVRSGDPAGGGVAVNGPGPSAWDFWLWKAFLGAFSLAEAVREGVVDPVDPTVETLRLSFRYCIRRWSKETGVDAWEDATAVLKRVGWPASHSEPEVARRTWEQGFAEDRVPPIFS